MDQYNGALDGAMLCYNSDNMQRHYANQQYIPAYPGKFSDFGCVTRNEFSGPAYPFAYGDIYSHDPAAQVNHLGSVSGSASLPDTNPQSSVMGSLTDMAPSTCSTVNLEEPSTTPQTQASQSSPQTLSSTSITSPDLTTQQHSQAVLAHAMGPTGPWTDSLSMVGTTRYHQGL